MSKTLSDTLLVNIRFINRTPQRFKRGADEHNGLEGSFPPSLSENNIEIVQFKAKPHLNGDILIDIGIKKAIFEARTTYTQGHITFQIQTRLLYAYELVPFRQAPKAVFYWEHNATSTGQQKVLCRSELRKHSDIYPYNYSVDFMIG